MINASQNSCDVMKAMLRGIFTTLSIYIREEEIFKSVSSQLKKTRAIETI